MSKKTTLTKFFKKLPRCCKNRLGSFLAIGATVTSVSVIGQTTYTFTSAGQTGPNGPTQGAVNTAYANTNLSGMVTVISPGIQSFTIPQTGVYNITATGASGGYNGGHGASISGNFTLTAGTVLKILVGQMGTEGFNGQYTAGGGGGGSFVTDNSNSILVIAGGGGGNGDGYMGSPVQCCSTTMESTTGSNGNPFPSGSNGGSGGGGGSCVGFYMAGSGAGFSGNGSSCQSGVNSRSFLNGGNAGLGNYSTGDGGFGGGGGCYNSGTGQRGGGGGGYSGGGGGNAPNGNELNAAGGGGGSYNNGASQVNSISTSTGNGRVIIKDLCTLQLTSTSNPMCAGGTVTLTTNAASNISWSPGGSTNSMIVVSPGTTTSYTVTGIGSPPTCLASVTRTDVITVSISPLPVITPVVSPTLLCLGSTATVTGVGASTYTWSNGPGLTTTLNPAVTTVYNVSGTSAFGCLNTATFAVVVNSITLGGTPSSTVCRGKSITLNATGAASYLWNSMLPFPSMVVTPSVAGIYTVSGVDQYGCLLSRTISVGINENPVIQATPDKNVVCMGEPVTLTASGANTYTWNNGVSSSSIVVTPTVDLLYYYTVTGTDNNNCTAVKTVTVFVSKCSSLSENTASAPARIFPNPSNGTFVLSIHEFSNDMALNIYNALGSLIKTQKISSADTEINIQNTVNGVYFLYVVRGDKTVQVSKVIKQ